jgi:D-amino-acid dehydrogenase
LLGDPNVKRVVICGAGVIGLCCAHFLRARGCEVTLVEREPEVHDGCSFGNAGMIVPSHFIPLAAPGMVARGLKCMLNARSPFYIRPRLDADLAGWCWRFFRAANAAHVARAAPLLRDLHFASRELFAELAAGTGNDFGLATRGLLMLCRTQRALDHEAAVAVEAERLGVPAQVLTAAQAAALDPGMRMDIAGAVHFPRDCHLNPQRFMATLTRLVRESGATFLWSSKITRWRHAGSRIAAAELDDGRHEIAADEFVLAGGSWSPALGRDLGLKLPLQPGKGYSLTLPQPRQLPQLCSILSEASIAVTPMGATLRVGGTMELSGFDARVRPERVQQIVESMPKYFPEFRADDFRDVPVWHGFRPCSPDGLPYVGRFARFQNLCAATGHAMMGLSLAPITGRLVAEIISGEKPSHDLALLSPDRFSN